MQDVYVQYCQNYVAPREGRVSRNPFSIASSVGFFIVAPREGRVSRNLQWKVLMNMAFLVAPREGRVSRNCDIQLAFKPCIRLRPARGV